MLQVAVALQFIDCAGLAGRMCLETVMFMLASVHRQACARVLAVPCTATALLADHDQEGKWNKQVPQMQIALGDFPSAYEARYRKQQTQLSAPA